MVEFVWKEIHIETIFVRSYFISSLDKTTIVVFWTEVKRMVLNRLLDSNYNTVEENTNLVTRIAHSKIFHYIL